MPFDPSIMQDSQQPEQGNFPGVNLASLGNQQPDPKQQVQQPGGLKGMLKGFLWGMSRGMMADAGIEAPEQTQLKQQQLAVQQQQANTQEGYRQFQQQVGQQELDLKKGMVTLPNGMQVPAAVAKPFLDYFGKTDVQGMKGEQAQAGLDSKETIANQQHELGKMKLDYALRIAHVNSAAKMAAVDVQRAKFNAMKDFGINPALLTKGLASFDDALQADKRLSVMQDALKNPNAQNDVAMLFNHIGMTLSAQKGARITNAEIERAIKTRDLPGSLLQQWDQVQSGRFLTPKQREQMVELGVTNRAISWENAKRKAELYGVTKTPRQDPNLPALPGDNAPPAGAKVRDYTQIKPN